MKHPALSNLLEQLHKQLQDIYGERLCQVILYGSQARATAQPDSDVDVLIVLQDPVNFAVEVERTSYLITALCLEHNVLITCTFIGEQRFGQQQGGFLRNVHREGIPL
jgi:uncharacterized protein